MRTKNQETLDRILKFVNKYYQEYHSSPTINDVAEGVGVARSTTHRYLQELSDRNLIDYSRGCLLYTSPSPRDRTRSRMPSSA